MMRFMSLLILVLASFFLLFTVVQADEYDDITKALNDLKSSLESSKKATATNEQTLTNLNQQLASIKGKVSILESEIAKKEQEVKAGEKDLAHQKQILDLRTVSNYKNLGKSSATVVDLLVEDNLSRSLEKFFYQKSLIEEDKKSIIKIVLYIKSLEEKKASLQSENQRLAVIKQQVDQQSQFLAQEVAKSKAYEGELQQKIAVLTTQQQQLIAQKLAALNLPRSAGSSPGGCSDDRDTDPGFSPRFAFFTYGIPHRVGMSQWGAYGRAKAGQDYKTILNAYFNNVRFECKNFPGNTINVQGYGSVNIGDYLKGLGEMPESWGNSGGYEALKAQVVAAASYAYSSTGGGSSDICTTQDCQVYIGHNKGGTWDKAVDEIKGKCGDGIEVMISNDTNEVVKAWYSSTFGGYEFTSGEVWGSSKPWTKHAQDMSSGVSGGDTFSQLNERAYDRESPFFYCDWGGRSEYAKTAWLKGEEVADIANTLSLAKRDGSVVSHLSQPDKPNPDGAETWDRERVKSELRARGGTPLNNVSDVGLDWDRGYGKVVGVHIHGDTGTMDFDGGEFKSYFNVRAPANIQIVGPLFNIEKR